MFGISKREQQGSSPDFNFPRPIDYPRLEGMVRYLTDVLQEEVAFEGNYRKTFTPPIPPRLVSEPRRFYTQTRTSSIRVVVSDIVLLVKEEMSDLNMKFTGIEFTTIEDKKLNSRQESIADVCRNTIREYFKNYK